MAFKDKILTSIFGRRLGLQRLSSGQTGGLGGGEFLVGPEEFRAAITSAETTATNLKSHGTSYNLGTSAASSAVYTIDPPIPGVRKVIACSSGNGPVYVKVANAATETMLSTIGSSFNTIKISSLGGGFEMIGLTTAQWLLYITSGTSSNASGFGLTTTT